MCKVRVINTVFFGIPGFGWIFGPPFSTISVGKQEGLVEKGSFGKVYSLELAEILESPQGVVWANKDDPTILLRTLGKKF